MTDRTKHASSAPAKPLTDTATPGQRALAWAHTARFLTTASKLDQLPPPGLPEIAFVGRSNAGKSTAINTLANTRRLAFASKTPGRTQHINLFQVGPVDEANAQWADLPGYGYAAVARGAKLRWQQVMADYLAHRHALAGIVMMVDSRHGFTPLDKQLLDFVSQRVGRGEVKLLVLLTKSDKLSRNELAKAISAAGQVLGEVATDAADISLVPFSALSRMGVEDAALVLHGWVTGAAPQAEGDGAATSTADAADAADPAAPAYPAEPAA
ncbi:MAG: YihA family ribosome biogenesis GTP-binding protein [Burkholderiales bacterium PBB5]|nr:MAG: YihA family ribosome biogenesis GTP-binding protein [Burkholderiales bacterium PBB5]